MSFLSGAMALQKSYVWKYHGPCWSVQGVFGNRPFLVPSERRSIRGREHQQSQRMLSGFGCQILTSHSRIFRNSDFQRLTVEPNSSESPQKCTELAEQNCMYFAKPTPFRFLVSIHYDSSPKFYYSYTNCDITSSHICYVQSLLMLKEGTEVGLEPTYCIFATFS